MLRKHTAPHCVCVLVVCLCARCQVKNISKEATTLIAKATEFFLAKFAEEACKMSSLSGR